MSTVYTKQQMDHIAILIGQKLKYISENSGAQLTQELGTSEDLGISQKLLTDELESINNEIGNIGQILDDINGV